MSATRTPLPQVGYQREHDGYWYLLRDGMIIGNITRSIEARDLTVMVDNLYWNIEGNKLQAHGGLAVKSFNKRTGLKLICIHVAFALREMEADGEVQPATIAPRVKPKITIDLEPSPAMQPQPGKDEVIVSKWHEDHRIRLDVGYGRVLMTRDQARAAWVLLGEYLCEPAGPGLDRRATPTPDGGMMRNGAISYPSPAMKARQAVRDGLETMWRMSFSTDPTDADLKCMARILKEMAS